MDLPAPCPTHPLALSSLSVSVSGLRPLPLSLLSVICHPFAVLLFSCLLSPVSVSCLLSPVSYLISLLSCLLSLRRSTESMHSGSSGREQYIATSMNPLAQSLLGAS